MKHTDNFCSYDNNENGLKEAFNQKDIFIKKYYVVRITSTNNFIYVEGANDEEYLSRKWSNEKLLFLFKNKELKNVK